MRGNLERLATPTSRRTSSPTQPTLRPASSLSTTETRSCPTTRALRDQGAPDRVARDVPPHEGHSGPSEGWQLDEREGMQRRVQQGWMNDVVALRSRPRSQNGHAPHDTPLCLRDLPQSSEAGAVVEATLGELLVQGIMVKGVDGLQVRQRIHQRRHPAKDAGGVLHPSIDARGWRRRN